MARTVEVELQLDSSGAVQKVESASSSFERLGQEADEAASHMDESAQASREQGQASERAAQGAREQAAAQERVASTGTRMNSTVSSSANNLGFELVSATQDAKFGMAGVANQIPLMTEQFTQLQQKTGSTTGAMGALFSALKGPAGIIGAFTLLLTFKDEIVSFFEDVGGGAESAAAGIEQVKGQLEETLDLGDLGDLGTDTDAIQEEVGRLEEGLQQLKQQRSRLAEESETAVERAAVSAQASLAEFLRSQGMSAEMVEQLGAAEGEAAEQASDAATRQDELDAAITQVNSRLQVLRGRLRAIDAVGEVAPDLLKDEGGGDSEPEDKLDAITRAAAEANSQFLRLQQRRQEGILPPLPGTEASLMPGITMPSIDAEEVLPPEQVQALNDQLRRIEMRPLQAASAKSQQQIQLATQAIREMQSEGMALSETTLDRLIQMLDLSETEAKRLRKELQATGEEMDRAAQKGVQFGQILSQGLANAITQAATALGEGGNALKAVGQVLGQLFQRLGKAMIAYGIGLEAVKTLNPVVAIAGGAALVAAGAALSSALSDTQDAIGGRRRSASTTRRDIADGGEATTGVDVPGRASGGPVRAGQPYMVGEEGPEMVVPGSNGFVFSNDTLQAATSSRSRTVNVRSQSQIGVEDVEVDADIFKLRARLNEIESEISELR